MRSGVTEATTPRAEESDDAIRVRLVEAATRVFARQGYAGTKIQDVVREAGLSTGAVYGRFRSKDDLLRAAIVEHAAHVVHLGDLGTARVADLIARSGQLTDAPLSDEEAVRLEAYVAARREPEIAHAILDATAGIRTSMQPLVEAAKGDGTLADDVDPEAVVYFLRAVGLGLLLQRAAGLPGAEPSGWNALVARVVRSFGAAANPQDHRLERGPVE